MGIQVEFNPDLALRKYNTPGRLEEECLPETLFVGSVHNFLKEGQRNYWFKGELPLLMTEGNQRLSRPLASIVILEATHFLKNDQVYTKGKYIINEVFDVSDSEIHFEGYKKL
ncbi:hypothetical protein J4466_04665 [Candidatus Pacearchaeota archaeon]|nr:hypothetical protein [Candidatus Pacearchaeota archaeon]